MSVIGVDEEVYRDGEVMYAMFLPLVSVRIQSVRLAPLRRFSEEQIKGLCLHQLLV